MNDGKIITYTGKRVNPFALEVRDIDFRDISHALSNICRFGGHSRVYLSVAQHSIYVAGLLPVAKKKAGLLHDATEAYLLDIPKPVKDRLPEYQAAELRAAEVIARAFNLPKGFQLDADVKLADARALDQEFTHYVHGFRMAQSNIVAKQAFIHYWQSLNNGQL